MKNQVYVKNKLEELEKRIKELEKGKPTARENFEYNVCKEFNILLPKAKPKKKKE